MICEILDGLPVPALGVPRRELITFVKDRPGHDRRYAIDCTKLREALGWIPEESFETGMQKTVSWYLNNRDWVERVNSGDYKAWMAEQYGKDD
jgi:dTDP-glucose 4,6-dehydratase